MLGSKQIASLIRLKPDCLVNAVSRATICHKSELPPKTTRDWPYEKYSYGFHNFWLDPFTKRKFNENTKIIQVEGNIHAGKHEFAKKLADELGMKYFPAVDLDDVYINKRGYDYRALNPLLPERMRACDLEMFHENPSRHSVIHMQIYFLKLRVYQMLQVLRHMYNTGQGCVVVRSAFTERAIVEAMHELGWLPRGYLRGDGCQFYDYKIHYNHLRAYFLDRLRAPHLTIYLETPIDTCLDRIRNDPNPMISQSKALIPEFLENIDRAYKDIILPKMENQGHVLCYDYPKRASNEDIMDVIDDIKQLDFEFKWSDIRFDSWGQNEVRKLDWFDTRRYVTSCNCLEIFETMMEHDFDIAGFGDTIDQIDIEMREYLYYAHARPFGRRTSLKQDLSFSNLSNFFRTLFDIRSYNETWDDELKADFS